MSPTVQLHAFLLMEENDKPSCFKIHDQNNFIHVDGGQSTSHTPGTKRITTPQRPQFLLLIREKTAFQKDFLETHYYLEIITATYMKRILTTFNSQSSVIFIQNTKRAEPYFSLKYKGNIIQCSKNNFPRKKTRERGGDITKLRSYQEEENFTIVS